MYTTIKVYINQTIFIKIEEKNSKNKNMATLGIYYTRMTNQQIVAVMRELFSQKKPSGHATEKRSCTTYPFSFETRGRNSDACIFR